MVNKTLLLQTRKKKIPGVTVHSAWEAEAGRAL